MFIDIKVSIHHVKYFMLTHLKEAYGQCGKRQLSSINDRQVVRQRTGKTFETLSRGSKLTCVLSHFESPLDRKREGKEKRGLLHLKMNFKDFLHLLQLEMQNLKFLKNVVIVILK